VPYVLLPLEEQIPRGREGTLNRLLYRLAEALLSGRVPDPRSREGFWTYFAVGLGTGLLLGWPR